MAYEVFKRSAIRVEEPMIAIAPRGYIVFNAAASRILAASGVKAALLLWDRRSNKLGIKATSKGDRNAFAVTLTLGRSGSLRAMTFLNYIGWRANKRESLPATWNEKEKMLETTLPSEFIAGTPLSETHAIRRKIRLE